MSAGEFTNLSLPARIRVALSLHNVKNDELVTLLLRTIANPTHRDLDTAIAPYRHGNTDEFDEVYKRTVAGYFKRVAEQ